MYIHINLFKKEFKCYLKKLGIFLSGLYVDIYVLILLYFI